MRACFCAHPSVCFAFSLSLFYKNGTRIIAPYGWVSSMFNIQQCAGKKELFPPSDFIAIFFALHVVIYIYKINDLMEFFLCHANGKWVFQLHCVLLYTYVDCCMHTKYKMSCCAQLCFTFNLTMWKPFRFSTDGS